MLETLEMALIDDPYNEALQALEEALWELPYPIACSACGDRDSRLVLLCLRCAAPRPAEG